MTAGCRRKQQVDRAYALALLAPRKREQKSVQEFLEQQSRSANAGAQ